jgi:hypothetical protein
MIDDTIGERCYFLFITFSFPADKLRLFLDADAYLIGVIVFPWKSHLIPKLSEYFLSCLKNPGLGLIYIDRYFTFFLFL